MCPDKLYNKIDEIETLIEEAEIRLYNIKQGNTNGPCYCTSSNQDEEEIKQVVSQFQANGVKETVRKML